MSAIGKEIAWLTEEARTETLRAAESAILGVGRIVKKPVVIKDEVCLRSMMTLTLVFDHRIMDGAVAARFLQTVKEKLEKPGTLQ